MTQRRSVEEVLPVLVASFIEDGFQLQPAPRPLQAGLYPMLLILALDTPASLLLLLFRLSYRFCLAFYPCWSLDLVCPPSPMFASNSFQNLLLPEAFLFFARTFDLFKILYLWVHYYDHYHMLLLISTIYIPVFPLECKPLEGKDGVLLIFVKSCPPN